MDILSLKPVIELTVICPYCKKEFNGQKSNSLLNYHLVTKPPFIANDWLRQQFHKISPGYIVLQDVISTMDQKDNATARAAGSCVKFGPT